MSERGSFTTEYIYCDKCFEACKEVLCGNDKWLKGVVVPMWTEKPTLKEQYYHFLRHKEFIKKDRFLPIIAGKIGGMYANEECHCMEFELIPQIQEKMCDDCKIRISVLAEQGSAIYEFNKTHVKELISGYEYESEQQND